jgi:serine/threonine-protein kinase
MTATATPVTLTREGFLQALRDSNVLTDSQFVKAVTALGDRGRSPRSAADYLVKSEFLTRFQSERLLTGRTDSFFIGPYLVLDYIGKSATGRAYKARHTTMSRLVAIKVISTALTKSEEIRNGIRAEARAVANLAHPNIVTLLDANQAGDRMYFVREYVDGPTLAEIVKSTGPLPVNQACEYIRQAALGLQHAHEKNAPHGKLAPTAILVGQPTKTGNNDKPLVKVSGFGLGRFTTDSSETDFNYTAPEQFQHPSCADTRADLYSLGCVLYFLLAGRPPFSTTSGEDAAQQHWHAQPPKIEYLRPEVPAALSELVHTLLAKHPRQRPTSAEEVALRLGAIAEELGGAIDYSLNVLKSTSASGSYMSGIGDEAAHEPLIAMPVEVPTSWDNIVNASETSDGTAAEDATPLGVRKRKKSAGSVNPFVLTLVISGVMLGVLLALLYVMRHFAN